MKHEQLRQNLLNFVVMRSLIRTGLGPKMIPLSESIEKIFIKPLSLEKANKKTPTTVELTTFVSVLMIFFLNLL
jgi:hypothetical protein